MERGEREGDASIGNRTRGRTLARFHFTTKLLTLLQGRKGMSLSRFGLKYFSAALGGVDLQLFPKSNGEECNRYNT
jgi:hypothetical protein